MPYLLEIAQCVRHKALFALGQLTQATYSDGDASVMSSAEDDCHCRSHNDTVFRNSVFAVTMITCPYIHSMAP